MNGSIVRIAVDGNERTFQQASEKIELERALEEENKLIEAGFEYVRYSEKHDVAIYKKPK